MHFESWRVRLPLIPLCATRSLLFAAVTWQIHLLLWRDMGVQAQVTSLMSKKSRGYTRSLASFLSSSTLTNASIRELHNSLKHVTQVSTGPWAEWIQLLQYYAENWERGLGISLPSAAEGNQLLLHLKQVWTLEVHEFHIQLWLLASQGMIERRHSWNTYLRQIVESSWHKAFKLNLLAKLHNVYLLIAQEIKYKFYKRNHFSTLSTEHTELRGQATLILGSAENVHLEIHRCK